jgi:hypothetical protein
MVASLVRLLHSGIQDERLLTNDFGCYVSVLVRAGRMTTQWSRIDFQQSPAFSQTAVCRLLKKGELITRLYLVANMPDIYAIQSTAAASGSVGPKFGWTNSLGHALVAQASISIGGSTVETIDSRLLEVMDEYNTPLEKVLNVNSMIGRIQNGFTETSLGNTSVPTQVIIPLPFWFSRGDLGAALPIEAISVDEVRVSIQFRPVNSLYYTESRSAAPVAGIEGSALWPMLGSQFYKTDLSGSVVSGLNYTGPVSRIPDVQMPLNLNLGDTYLLAEYIYLDKPEANRFRLADIEIPIVQHVAIDVKDTQRAVFYQIPFEIQNPIRHLYFMGQNYNASTYNAFFVSCANLRSGDDGVIWPDCEGLNGLTYSRLKPGYLKTGNEPFNLIELVYEGSYVRTSTENCALYRSILPSLEERKSPWINRYMYCIPFGMQAGYTDPSVVMGEANMNRINKKELRLGIVGGQQIRIYCWAETYNVLKIYGGRAALLFSY